ncbi:MAG: DUF2339 domain-containing protein [Erythrobacter sp.]|nr:MAG: DUF2339 domain-containing protein [Erythrobacter sp.]
MEWLFIIGMGAVLVGLWGRVQKLERRLRDLQEETRSHWRAFASEAVVSERSRPDAEFVGEPEPEPQVEPAPEPEPEKTLAWSAPAEEPTVSEPLPPPAPLGAEDVAPAEADTSYSSTKFDFEDIFGRRLPIWAGGIALAAGGIFLVIYAIEQGLMGPEVRTALSFVFGLLLLGAAEAAYQFEERVADPRVRQALAGAGLATLYAAFYLAGAQYGLIGPGLAFAGLALVTAVALALTSRFGLPTAVLGLLGGFATPVLVASEEANVPVLAFYLALLTAGLALTAKRMGQRWLGLAAMAGGFLWGVLMLAGLPSETEDVVAIGLYLLALGALVPLLLADDAKLPLARLASGAIAAAQMGALVSLAGYDLLTWGLYLLLAAALAVLAWRIPALRPAGALVAAVGVILLATWPEPMVRDFIVVMVGFGAIVLGAPLGLLWRRDSQVLELAQVSLGALALGLVCRFHFGSSDNELFLPGLSVGLTILSATAALAVWRAWLDEALSRYLALPTATAALLSFGALHVVLPDWAEVLGAVAVTLVLAEIMRRMQVAALAALGWAGGVLTLVTLFSTGGILEELSRAVGNPYGDVDRGRALIRWIAATLPFAALALLEWRRRWRRAAEILAGLCGYVVLAQVIPAEWLAWTAALVAVALLWWQRERTGLWGALLAVALLWSLHPVAIWIGLGFEAISGLPMLVSDLPTWTGALRYVMPLALAAGFAAWRVEERRKLALTLAALAGAAGTVVLHVLYKQLFAIADDSAFVALGMAERTVWQALLIGGGIALARFVPRTPWRATGMALIAAGLWHFTLFGFLLHNPLWDAQATDALPLANWLAPAYLAAGVAVWWLTRLPEGMLRDRLRRLGDGVLMLLISFWALSELRHSFAGSLLTSVPMSQTEDLLRSLLGIVLALGFLWWGSRNNQRTWRIGSLVLMLIAVLKVFLVDAAGLEGLLRIASFLALGVSLIGIGWIYSRQLSSRVPEPVV